MSERNKKESCKNVSYIPTAKSRNESEGRVKWQANQERQMNAMFA